MHVIVSCKNEEVAMKNHYVNVSVLIKNSLNSSVFYLNYHNISIKLYVVDVYKNRLGEAILIHIHNI